MEQWVHILTGLYAGLMLVNLITYMLEYDWWGFNHRAFVAILFAVLVGIGVPMAVKSIKGGYWLEVLAGAGMAFVALGVCQLLIQNHYAYFGPELPKEEPFIVDGMPFRFVKATRTIMYGVLDDKDQPIIYVGLGALAAIARIVLTAYIRS